MLLRFTATMEALTTVDMSSFGTSFSLPPRRCPSVGLGLDRPVTPLELLPNLLSLWSRQFSLLISFELLTIPPLTTTLPFRHDHFVTLLQRRSLPRLSLGRTCFSRWDLPSRDRGSSFARTLPDRLGQIEFVSYGLVVHLRLLPTFVHTNAVTTVGCRAVTLP